ncbi:prolipoprotein diacylglyceryl transferase [Blautia schinkii]|nr:prolipoprotein diacylglyceryl transferase [Blautia schinkii]
MDMSIRFPHLGLELDYVGKSLHIFGFEITIYGILIAVGMLLGIAFVVLEAKRRNQNQDMYLDMVILSLVAAVIGARLYYVAFSWSLYKGNILQIFNTRSGGMALYGGILGGVLAAVLFCRIKKANFWQMADTASMGILIGQIIGRWGNFFNRESFGEYTDSLFAMQLPLSAVRASEVTTQMRENLVTIDGISYIQVHPAFLYESLWCLLLFLLLLAWRRRKRFQGELFMRYLAGYGFGRFFIEWLRTDQLTFPGTKIAVSQIVSALLFIIFGVTVFVRRAMVKKRAELRKRRREETYEAEEKAAREMDLADEAAQHMEPAGENMQESRLNTQDLQQDSMQAEEQLDTPEGQQSEISKQNNPDIQDPAQKNAEAWKPHETDEWNQDAAHTDDAWRATRAERTTNANPTSDSESTEEPHASDKPGTAEHPESAEDEWYMRPRQRWGRVEDITSEEYSAADFIFKNPKNPKETGQQNTDQTRFTEESDSEPKA